LLLVVLGEFFSAPGLPLADSCTLSHVKDQPQEFGRIRLFGSVGWGLAMFVMGIGLDYSNTFANHPCPTENTTEKNYTLCFVTCSVLMMAAIGVASQFRFEADTQQRPDEVGVLAMNSRIEEVDPAIAEKARARAMIQSNQPSQQDQQDSERAIWLATLRALMSAHFGCYLLAVLVVGLGAGLVFGFLFWHLQDLGGSPILFGIASISNHSAEIFAHFYAFKMINRFGHVKIMYMCLGANVFRFLVLSVLSNPWMVLPLQVIQGVTVATVWASASSYISLTAPEQLKSKAQFLLLVIYNGFGKAFGTIFGGLIISSTGSRAVFLLYAILCLLVLGLNYAVNRVFKYENVKYRQDMFDEDDYGSALAPQGIPLASNDNKIKDAFNQSTNINSNYGTIEADPTQDAYDQYVRKPYG